MELYPSVPKLKVEKSPRDRKKTWTQPGAVNARDYDLRLFKDSFSKPKRK